MVIQLEIYSLQQYIRKNKNNKNAEVFILVENSTGQYSCHVGWITGGIDSPTQLLNMSPYSGTFYPKYRSRNLSFDIERGVRTQVLMKNTSLLSVLIEGTVKMCCEEIYNRFVR